MWLALAPSSDESMLAKRFMLWIDGVGAFLVITADDVTIGRMATPMRATGATSTSSTSADIALSANLSREHVVIRRMEEQYLIEARSKAAVDQRELSNGQWLKQRSEITLNDSVRLEFVMPTPLSSSARLKVLSDHRRQYSVDGYVLMGETCLLGRGHEHHVVCPEWNASVVLARHSSGLVVRSQQPLTVDGEVAVGLMPLRSGQTVVGDKLRFRMEEVAT